MDKPPREWPSRDVCILGIDEAGRGPCLGPMVYSAAYCRKVDHDRLVKLGANDSKQLTEEQRDNLREVVDKADFVGTDSIVLHASELSAKMLRPLKYNLNAISHDTALSLVQRAMDRGVNVKEVYVDTVGSPEAYAQKFRDAFPTLEKVVVEKKADSKFAVVSVASIVAKTTRDFHVKNWVFDEETRAASCKGPDALSFKSSYGSGYPSDPRTQEWLSSHVDNLFGFPSFVRFSWSTARLILDREAVEIKWECDVDTEADDDVASVGKKRKFGNIQNFFQASSNSACKQFAATSRMPSIRRGRFPADLLFVIP